MSHQSIIESVILGAKHKHYDDTVLQSKFGTEVTTGKGQESYIIRLKQEWNQSKISDRHKEEIKQAKRLYNSATPAAFKKLSGYFERVFRVDKSANTIKASSGDLNTEFEDELKNFGGKGLMNYLETNYLFLNGVDPNAWLLIETTTLEGKERINPLIIRSKDVLNYSIKLGVLEYLAIQSGLMREKELMEWFFYFKDVKYKVLEDHESLTTEDKKGGEQIKIEDRSYWLFETKTSIDKVPAIRWGYMFNFDTDGDTFAYFWDAAKNQMKDLMDRKFQLDMSYMLHTFLQKIQYGDRCTYHDGTRSCQNGLLSGTTESCPSCKGSGVKAHKDASDLIVIAFPEEGDGKVKIAPKDIADYISMPFDIVEEQRNRVDSAPIKMVESVFGVDMDRTGAGITTAAEIKSGDELGADKLSTFAEGLTHIQRFVVDCTAKIKGISLDSYENSLSYPNEFGLDSMNFLLKQLKDAKEAGADYSIVKAIENKIAAKQNKGNKDKLDFDRALNMFKPFKQLSQTQLEAKLSTLPETNKFKVAFEYFDMISQDILNRQPLFHKLDSGGKKALFEIVTSEYIAIVKAEIESNRDEFREEIEELD